MKFFTYLHHFFYRKVNFNYGIVTSPIAVSFQFVLVDFEVPFFSGGMVFWVAVQKFPFSTANTVANKIKNSVISRNFAIKNCNKQRPCAIFAIFTLNWMLMWNCRFFIEFIDNATVAQGVTHGTQWARLGHSMSKTRHVKDSNDCIEKTS